MFFYDTGTLLNVKMWTNLFVLCMLAYRAKELCKHIKIVGIIALHMSLLVRCTFIFVIYILMFKLICNMAISICTLFTPVYATGHKL